MNRRRMLWPTLALALAAPLAVATTGDAAPNPYGQGSTHVVVTLDGTGGYQSAISYEQQLVLPAKLSLGWHTPNHVRLPDDHAHPLPGLLELRFGEPAASINGDTVEVATKREGRAVIFSPPSPEETFGEGTHTATITPHEHPQRQEHDYVGLRVLLVARDATGLDVESPPISYT